MFQRLLALTAAAFLFTGCAQGSNSASDLPSSSGSDRLTWSNESVELDRTNSAYGDPNSAASTQSLTVPLSLSLVASLTPPTVNGSLVYATDVKVSGTKVYVSYNTPGANYGGGIDVISTLVPALPVLTSSMTDATRDFSQLLLVGTNLYAVGAMDTSLADSAIVNRYALSSGNIVGSTPAANAVIAGNVGLGLASDGTSIYAASGNSGGLSVLDPTTLAIGATASLDGSRDVKMYSGKPLILTGETASVHAAVSTYSTAGVYQSVSSVLAGAVVDEAKSTLQTGTTLHVATAGVGGTNLICAATGAIASHINIPAVAGLTAAQQAANAAVFSNGLIYIANGGAGIYVYTVEMANPLVTNCNVTTNYLGKISFPDGDSVNNLTVSGGYLIAANGAGGFKIILLTTNLVFGLLGTL